MPKEVMCDCGVVIETNSLRRMLRCPKCGSMVVYGKMPEATIIGWRESGSARPEAKRPPLHPKRKPVEDEFPIEEMLSEERPSRPKKKESASLAAPADSSVFEFEPGTEPAPEKKMRPAKKKRARPEPKPFSEEDLFGSAPLEDPLHAETEEQLRERRRPRPADPADSLEAGWHAWLDPAALLWIPILSPAFAIASGTAIAGATITMGGQSGMQVNPFLTVFGCLLLVPFVMFMTTHFSEIVGLWAMGTKTDPDWPDLTASDMMRDGFRGFCCALGAAAVGGICSLPILLWLGYEEVWPKFAAGAIFAIVFGMYGSVAFLACVLWQDFRAANPLLVMGTLLRNLGAFFPFFFEFSLHLGILGLLGWATKAGMAYSAVVGFPLWLFFWSIAILSGSRLARALGIVYARNHADFGWFK